MNNRWDVLGFGAIAVDDLIYVDSFPSPNSKTRVQSRRREGGGLVATALVAASRLGARTAYATVLGDDDLSHWSVEELERERVDCAPILFNANARPHHSTIIVDSSNGARSILSGNDGVMQYENEWMTPELIGGARVLIIDHTVLPLAKRAVEIARQNAIPIVADLEREVGEDFRGVLTQIDHLIVGLDFGRKLTGEITPENVLRKLSVSNRACCALTDGERGCWFSQNGGAPQHIAAWRVEVVDTTGCGDVFHGAYAAEIARGESVETAIQNATITAGIKATQRGGRSGIPNRATVDQLINGAN